jgi:hypothetical protein
MQPSESPFPCHWWGIALDKVGLAGLRPDVGTYGRYDFNRLPPLPLPLRGDFAWLTSAPLYEHNIGNEKAQENAQALVSLQEASTRAGVQLPKAFITFMATPGLQERIRSNTDCFLDLCAELIPSPVGGGYLVRFLADSQGCIFWYLYLPESALDHAVVSSPGFYGTEAEQWQENTPDPADIVFNAESFEAFMCRFWLENEIWFADCEGKPIPELGRRYIERYREK